MFSKAMILSFIPAVMAFLAGAVLPFQATSNGAVGKALGQKKDLCSANKRRTEDPLTRGNFLKQNGF